MSEKRGLSYTNQEKSGQSYTFLVKRGLIIYLAPLKKGAIRHAHLYYATYTKYIPPPLPAHILPHVQLVHLHNSLVRIFTGHILDRHSCAGWFESLLWAHIFEGTFLTLQLKKSLYMGQRTTKPTTRPMWPAKTQISLYIHSVWKGFSLVSLWIAKRLLKVQAISEDTDQTARMRRLVWVFAGGTSVIVCFVVLRLTSIFDTVVDVVTELYSLSAPLRRRLWLLGKGLWSWIA